MLLELIIYIFIALLAVFFFAGMETAFIAAVKTLPQTGTSKNAPQPKLIRFFLRNEQQFISTLFTGKYLSMIAFAWSVVLFCYSLGGVLGSTWGVIPGIILIAALFVAVIEIVPKTIFRNKPERWLNSFAWLLLLFYILFYPISKIVSLLSVKLVRPFHSEHPDSSEEHVFPLIALNYLLQEPGEKGEGNSESSTDYKIFQNVLDFSNVKLRDCLVPRTEIVALPDTVQVEQLLQTFIETGLSKILIYKEQIDNMIGYIHSSEMFTHQKEWRKQIKKLPIVPENMAAQKLMKTFMQEKKSIAVVVDEFGGTVGIVTLEDIMEEIFGEIEDEHDVRDYKAEKIGEKSFLLSGRLEVWEVNEQFNLNIPVSEDYTTVAGYILHEHQHFPKLNEIIQIDNFTIKFLKVTHNRIELIKLDIGD